MTFPRTLLIIIIMCGTVAWLAGPVGRFVVVLPLLLFGPGYLLDRAVGVRFDGLFTRPALWLGLSMSVVAILYEWATVIHISLSATVLQGLALLCAVGVIILVDRETRSQEPGARSQELSLPHPTSRTAALMLLAVFAVTLWLRFVQIEALALPNWVDSVHHALMIRVAAETGFAPISLQPYLPIDQLPYHWGYHVFAAAVLQLSGLPLPQMMLWEGQVLNALHVLAGAALATFLWRRPTAGIVAGATIGLVSLMPAYYVSWGRYTQLEGLLLVPPLAIVWRTGLYTGVRRWWIHAAVLLAGLSLIHFRILVFALALIAVISIVWVVARGWPSLRIVRAAALSTVVSLLLAGPWLLLLATVRLAPIVEQPQAIVSDSGYAALNTGLLWAGQNQLLVTLALLVALWGIRRRSLVVVEQLGWVAGMVVLANPWLASYTLPAVGALLLIDSVEKRRPLRIVASVALLACNPWLVRVPSSWLITNDVVSISLFFSIAVLISGGVTWLYEQNSVIDTVLGWLHLAHVRAARPLTTGALTVALVAYALWSGWDQRNVVNNATVLATPADVTAIQWVAEHTPTDARFLINAAAWLPSADRGIDGGWWLLPLAGRWMSTPPVIADYGPWSYLTHMRQVSSAVVQFQPDKKADLYAMIAREHITYIYIGPKPGPLTPAIFASDARFQQVYAQGGVTIFAVK